MNFILITTQSAAAARLPAWAPFLPRGLRYALPLILSAFVIGSLCDAQAAPDLKLHEKVPNQAEKDVVGLTTKKIVRGTPEFALLVKNMNADVVFKDEEKTGADRMMSSRMKGFVDALAPLVKAEWAGVKLRITEAWDEDNEHSGSSTHYEGRGADITASDMDKAKLGRLGRLAVDAGFDWVFFENNTGAAHVHVSVKREPPAPDDGASSSAPPPIQKSGQN